MVRITVLIENSAANENLKVEHGLSYGIEIDNELILFDTGQTGAFVENADVLGFDIGGVSKIVLSHGHYDHTGGLGAVLERVKKAAIYMHPDAFEAKFKCIARRPAKDIAMPQQISEGVKDSTKISSVVLTEKVTEITSSLKVTGQVPRVSDFEDVGGPFFKDTDGKVPDTIRDDQSLFFECSEGTVVLLGCAHAGVVNTLNYIAEITKKSQIYAVIGGMHLNAASDERIGKTLDALKAFNVKMISPVHCTGKKAVQAFQEAFPEEFRTVAAGSVLEFD